MACRIRRRVLHCLSVKILGCVLMGQQLGACVVCDIDTQGAISGVALLATKMSLKQLHPEETPMETNMLLPSSGCQYTFIDVGANSGDTVNAFLDASKERPAYTGVQHWDPLRPTTGDFDYAPFQDLVQEILKETSTTQHSYCVLGLEANEAWGPHFKAFQSKHSKRVEYLGMYSGLAVGVEDGMLEFQCARVDPSHSRWADGQPDEDISHEDQYPCVVHSRSLPSILRELHGRPPRVLILKIDVESSINTVLPPFLSSGALAALSSEGAKAYMIVDPMHMNASTQQIFRDIHGHVSNVSWYEMSVTNGQTKFRAT